MEKIFRNQPQQLKGIPIHNNRNWSAPIDSAVSPPHRLTPLLGGEGAGHAGTGWHSNMA